LRDTSYLIKQAEFQKMSASGVRRGKAAFFPVGVNPTRLLFQPEATGATVEVTKRLKPPVKRAAYRWQRECAGRNVSER
jgi:hypothetical protein